MSTLPPDLSYLERLYKGDRARIAAWVAIYLEEIPLHLERAAESVHRDDAAGLAAVVHDLRPQAHYLGARWMMDVLVDIGQRARSEGAASCAPALQELRAACTDVEAALRSRFGPAEG